MEDFKEFEGRDFDDCVEQAVAWFDSSREMLEIEFLQDARSGLFGIVGARKASIRARRAPVLAVMRALGQETTEKGLERQQKSEKSKKTSHGDKVAMRKKEDSTLVAPDSFMEVDEEDSLESTPWPVVPLEELDQEKLKAAALEIMKKLVQPLAGDRIKMEVDLRNGHPRVRIHWNGDAGILIGREGQTLVALQYLASRILSRIMKAALRVQLDIGDYRARQDNKLRTLAYNLADKARQTGRSFATRPLSSYHRRIIHMCLQKFPDIQTSSTGEGPMKRVHISQRRR